MNKKYKIVLPIIAFLLVASIYVAYSYAIFSRTKNQSGNNIVTTGCFNIEYTEGNYDISLTNAYPVSDSEGKMSKPYTVSIRNTCTVSSAYSLKLQTLDNSSLPNNMVRINLTSSTVDYVDKTIFDSSLVSDLQADTMGYSNVSSSYLLSSGYLKAASSENANDGGSISFDIRLWIDSEATNDIEGLSLNAKIIVENQATDTKWDLGCDSTSNTLNCAILAQNGGRENISVFDSSKESGIYKDNDNLGTTYYYFNMVENNYVLFNNMFWRIVRINGDGTIRLIYDGDSNVLGGVGHPNKASSLDVIVSEDYAFIGESIFGNDNNKYSGSEIESYLNEWYTGLNKDGVQTEKFSYSNGSLSNYDNYIANALFCEDKQELSYDNSFKCSDEGTIYRKIGLLTYKELEAAEILVAVPGSYLASYKQYWTMNDSHTNSGINVVTNDTISNIYYPGNQSAFVRPVINLVKEVTASGTGTASDPYVINVN